jgi:glycosyltransferase involved in cell wall biosynthesis
LSTLPQHHFDVVWAMGIDALQAVARAGITGRTTFVDADLESLKLRRRLDSGSGLRGLRRLVALIDVRRWQRLERAAAAAATGFSVCSEEERRRLGTTAFVTPNTYSIPPGSTDALRRSSDQPTLLFVGSLHYEPNVDGLRWFVTVVWPMIRREQPSARLRIVGSGGRETDWLRTADGVDLLGPVDDLEGELRAASVAIVPLRWGAGTRIKILESFAYRLPVVSTGLGAEGLDVEHRRELLIADGAQPFADGCLELLADEDYARRLGDAGHARFMARYEESVVRHALTVRLVDAVTAADADGLISDR